jgi:DNA-binding NarL/FixJ family response regulator
MRVLLVDDDESIVESFKIILSVDSSIEVIGSAKNGQEAWDFVKDNQVDLVLMDIRMPKMDGIEATMHIKKEYPKVKIIILTTFKDFRHIHQALHAGASGYLLKTDDVSNQIATIKSVYQGQAVISEEALIAFTSSKKNELLTERENDLVKLIAEGYSNKEISGRLFISEGTVRNVISVVLEKLMLRDRTQIAIYYWQTLQNQ